MKFYLGTHQPGWLNDVDVPLFISDRRLRGYRTLPTPINSVSIDSGGFTELLMNHGWSKGPTAIEYVGRLNRYQEHMKRVDWAAPQDWMCEPFILAKTGLTVREHQWRTIDNWFELQNAGPDVPIIPVVQGQTVDDYLQHVDFYRAAGLDLTNQPLVGVGSVCRRQATDEAVAIFQALHDVGVTRLHGFGLKKLGLAKSAHLLTSADSMAWSFQARRKQAPLEGCVRHINCANCRIYALRWRGEVLSSLPEAVAA